MEDIVEKVKEALQNNLQDAAVEMIQKYMKEQENIPLNIAITGESGCGKSTFLNAFRGIEDDDERAARTGCTETTTKVEPYLHPNYPNVTLWDLPGVGTIKFPADKYLEYVGFEKYDFFIIISAVRFRENDVKLAKEIEKMGKKFYFVHSKIDNDLYNEKRSKKTKFNKEETLGQIRENRVKGLEEQGFPSPQVFLVSSFELHLYDLKLLHETLDRELLEHKRDVLLLAMSNISLEIINKKKKAFQTEIKHWATASAVCAGHPGLPVAADVYLMVGVVKSYLVGFGLDIPSLKRLSGRSGVSFEDLKAEIVSPLTNALIFKLLVQSADTSLAIIGEAARFIPILGIPVSMGLSFKTTYKGLQTFLNMLANDAQRVFERALGLNTSV